MATFKSDYAFGIKKEIESLDKLNGYFDTKLVYRGGFSTFDYDNGNNVFVELKSRRIRHDQYDTTIIGANKVDSARDNPHNTYWFCFSYEDGLYGIKFEPEKFADFVKDFYRRGDRSDYNNRPQLVYFIPTKELIKLD